MTEEKILIEIEVKKSGLAETEATIKKVSAALVKLNEDKVNNAAAIKGSESELRVYNQRLREQQRYLDAVIKADQAKAGSLEQLKAQYVANTKLLNQMTADEIKNTKAGQDLVAQNLQITTTLKEVEKSYGQNARNVGNYEAAVKPLKTQLREAVIEMQKLAAAGKEDSAAFRQLQADAGRMREVMDDVGESVKRLANNPLEIALNGIVEGAKGVAAGFALAQSATVLFGEENKALQETMVKLQATMLLLNSLSEIQQLLRKESALSTLLDSRATIANTVAKTANSAITSVLNASMSASIGIMRVLGITTVATSGAFRVLTTAIAASGIGLLIVGVSMLIPKLIEWTQSTDDQADSEKKLVSAVEVGNKVMEDRIRFLDLVAAEGDRVTANNIRIAKSLGASEAQINAIQKKGLEDRIKNIKDEENVIIGSISAIEGWSIKRVRAVADNADRLIEVVQNKNNKYTENEVKLFTELFKLNQEYDNIITDLDVMGNEKRLKAQEEYAKKKVDALKALNELERRLFAGQIDYETNQLGLKLDADLKLVGDNLALRKALYEQYTLDVAALYRKQLESENLANVEFEQADILRDQAELERVRLQEQAKLDIYNLAKAERSAADDALVADQQKTQDEILSLIQKSSDAINLAFTNSLTEAGLDVKKFQKQFIGIMIDTIEGVLQLQYPALLASLTTSLGAVGGPIAFAAITATIKGLFALAKNQISQFEFGGLIPKAANGMLVGPSHAQGGIKISTPSGMIEAEGGEAIINKRSTKMFAPVLSAINQAGGGVKFAEGGITPTLNSQSMNFADLLASLPAPVVTVTDINRVSNQMQQITVKSTL